MNSTWEPFPSVSAGSGAKFHRVDLHIHSFGASADVAEPGLTPAAIIAKATERGIALVALADHNSVANVEALLTEAEASGGAVAAIPGVEITTSQGHVLVFCAPQQRAELPKLLIKLDLREDEQGEKYTRESIEAVAQLVEKFGGIAIPAHSGRESTGFMTKAPHRECQAVFESPAILGVELDTNADVDWFTPTDRTKGHQQRLEYLRMRGKALGGTPAAGRLARLLFSDAHTLEAIGTARDGTEKLTRIKMETPSFDGLIAALRDPDARIVLEHPLPEIYPRVVGIRYIGGFLDGQEIAFAPNLTALIGGRGAGKSTAMEALRCGCVGERSTIEGSDAWPQSIQIEYLDSFGGRHFLQRDAGADETNELVDDGTAVPTEIPLEGYEQDHIARVIRSTDKNPRPLLDFLDRFVASSALDEITDLKGQLEDNAADLLPVFGAPQALKRAREELAVAKGRINVAEKTKAKEALTYRRLLNSERQLREVVLEAIDDLDASANEVPEQLDLAALAQEVGVTDLSQLPAKAILMESPKRDSVAKVLSELATSVVKWKGAGAKQRSAFRARLDALLSEWEERDRKIEAKIQTIVEKLRAEGITPDLSAVNKLAASEAAAQKQVTKHSRAVNERKRLVTARGKLLRRYRLAQERLTYERNRFGKNVAQQFRGAGVPFAVGVKFREGRLVEEFEEWLRDGIGNRFLRGDRVTQFCQSIHPIDLADLLRTNRTTGLTARRDANDKPFFSTDEARDFIAHLGSSTERVLDLETIVRGDRPEISLTQTQDGKTNTYPFRHLSFGQRASILLGILLFSDDVHPLVIDQPEDHLDSAFIYDAVVQTLRRVKERRQVIVATHNANIAVLGDAELIVPLHSWAGAGHVTDRGRYAGHAGASLQDP